MDRNASESPEVRFSRENKSRESVEACLQAFRHEADVLEVVRDLPYIARLKDRFEENGTEYIILTLIQGQDLSAYTKKRGGKLPVAEVLSMFQNIFDTLAELHSMGFIHRDISPGNLMRSEDNLLYLIDFSITGAAAAFQALLEGHGMVKQLRALSLCEFPFLPRFLMAALNTMASLIDKDILITS